MLSDRLCESYKRRGKVSTLRPEEEFMAPIKLHSGLSDKETKEIAKNTLDAGEAPVKWRQSDVSGKLDMLKAEVDEIRVALNEVLRCVKNKKD
jgi:hypothetical protein